MSFYAGAETVDGALEHTQYLRCRAVEEADAAARAPSHAATLIHVALATAYAERFCSASDQAWIAATRLW